MQQLRNTSGHVHTRTDTHTRPTTGLHTCSLLTDRQQPCDTSRSSTGLPGRCGCQRQYVSNEGTCCTCIVPDSLPVDMAWGCGEGEGKLLRASCQACCPLKARGGVG
eukprot:352503-Chlamydomonas_euryale.AAC.1